jgi:hypothetical protein
MANDAPLELDTEDSWTDEHITILAQLLVNLAAESEDEET